MVVKSLICLLLLFSYTMSHDLLLNNILTTILTCIVALSLTPDI